MNSGIAAAIAVIAFCAWLGAVLVIFGGGMSFFLLKATLFWDF